MQKKSLIFFFALLGFCMVQWFTGGTRRDVLVDVCVRHGACFGRTATRHLGLVSSLSSAQWLSPNGWYIHLPAVWQAERKMTTNFIFSQTIWKTVASITNSKQYLHLLLFATSTSWNPQSLSQYIRALRRRGGRVKGKFTRALMFINRIAFFFPIFFLSSFLTNLSLSSRFRTFLFHFMFSNHCHVMKWIMLHFDGNDFCL